MRLEVEIKFLGDRVLHLTKLPVCFINWMQPEKEVNLKKHGWSRLRNEANNSHLARINN
jgi:hypothetical protein